MSLTTGEIMFLGLPVVLAVVAYLGVQAFLVRSRKLTGKH